MRTTAPPAVQALITLAGLILLHPAFAVDPEGASAATETMSLEDCRISAGPGFPGIAARCGTLRRPLDPSDDASAMLALHVAVVPALSLEPRPDPLLPIAGGPGQASTEFYAAYAQAFEDIRRERDIVLIDQRGTGKSAALNCPADEPFVTGRLAEEEVLAEARRCLEALPFDPRFFTTSVAVTDLEALRIALGYPSFNIYGVSYGTRVAQHFARRYPDSVRSVILDGVVPPQTALGPEIALEAQKALDAIFERCVLSWPCRERFPDLGASFDAVRATLQAAPVEVQVPDPLDWKTVTLEFGITELAGTLRLLSYHPNTVALMPLLIHEARAGNYRPLASQFLMAAAALQDALSLGMHNSIVCTEDAPFFDLENVRRPELELTYMGAVQLDALVAMCELWPRGVLDEDLRQPLATDKPVLLLSGDADPITPPRFADMAAEAMLNSKHLIGADQGHGQANRTCIPGIMAEFVAAASVAGLDEDCLVERQFAMPFFLDYTGPSP